MKKAYRKTIAMLLISNFTFIFIIMFCLIALTYSWQINNRRVTINSEQLYSVNQGFGGGFSSYSNFSINDVIYLYGDVVDEATFVPGDLIYYSFIFSIKKEDLISSKTNYSINLVLTGKATDDAPEGYGKYLAFLKDCCVEENSCIYVVLQKNDNVQGGATSIASFSPQYYYNDNGTMKMVTQGMDTAGITTYNGFDSTTPARFTSQEIASFCADGTEESIGARTTITIPILPEYPVYTDEENIEYVWFMIYVPIWYKDTEIVQNDQMHSHLEISGCSITLAN